MKIGKLYRVRMPIKCTTNSYKNVVLVLPGEIILLLKFDERFNNYFTLYRYDIEFLFNQTTYTRSIGSSERTCWMKYFERIGQ